MTFWVWESEFGLVPDEPPPCRGDVVGFLPATRDTLVCDPSTHINSRYLLTAVGSQNYGSNVYRIRQPFDFAGRTGRIVFDTDLTTNFLLGYMSIVISEDPSPTPTWDLNGRGPNPRNGLMLVFVSNNVEVYDVRDYALTTIAGAATTIPAQKGRMSRVELRLSTTQLEVLCTCKFLVSRTFCCSASWTKNWQFDAFLHGAKWLVLASFAEGYRTSSLVAARFASLSLRKKAPPAV